LFFPFGVIPWSVAGGRPRDDIAMMALSARRRPTRERDP
jgi:hypothetical protein